MLDTFKSRLKIISLSKGVNNLSTKRIDALAAKLDKKHPDLKEDAEHDKVIEEFHELFPLDEIAKTDDRVSSLEAKLKKPKDETPKDQDDSKKDDKKDEDEPPKWAKSLLETVQNLQKEKNQQSISVKVSSHEKLKDIPADFYDEWPLPEKEEDVEAFVDKVVAKNAKLNQALADKGFEQVTKPVNGVKPDQGKEKVSSNMSDYLKDKKEQREAQTQKTS